jgi:hypothetical protein
LIPLTVISKFLYPLIRIIPVGVGELAAFVLVPVTAMGEYSNFVFAQYYVGFDFFDLAIESESIAEAMKGAPC